MNKRISIIIPCYNAGSHLLEAIDAAAAQTYQDKEIIIMNDGSTDADSLAVLEAVKKDVRVLFFSQGNAGPASARNAAIAKASGKYILPLDADDIIDSTYVEKAIAILEKNENIDIVYCDAEKFGEESGFWSLPEFSFEQMAVDNVIFCTSVYRRSDWELVGGYPDLRKGMEDYGFWLRLLRRGKVFYKLKEPLFFYRIKKKSRTTEFSSHQEDIIHTYAEIFRDNVDYFAEHAEAIYRNRFSLYKQIRELEALVGEIPFKVYLKQKVKNYLSKNALLYKIVSSIYHKASRFIAVRLRG